MAVYSKNQLKEQTELIGVIRALTAFTISSLRETSGNLKEFQDFFAKIDGSLKKVFEAPVSGSKAGREYISAKRAVPERTVLVFLSSNRELYGDLIPKIAKLFTDDLSRGGADGLIIGKIGKLVIEKEAPNLKFQLYELDDDRPDPAVLLQILKVIESYSKVVVYHGKSDSMFRQFETKSELIKTLSSPVKPSKKYFFEPTPFEVLDLLLRQIAFNSFQQKLYEGHIARLSARRWNWMKQQLTRTRILEEMTRQYKTYLKSAGQKQQQVTIFAHRLNVSNDPIFKGSSVYG